MGSYDTAGSGFMDKLAGQSPRDPHGWGTAPGSAGAGADGAGEQFDLAANLAAASSTHPLITAVQDPLVMGKEATVGPLDTLTGGQEGSYTGDGANQIFGGVSTKQFGPGTTYGPGRGRANHFRHPNGLQAEGTPEGHA